MTIDKRKLYILSSALLPAFLLVCFVTNAVMRRYVLTAVAGAALIAAFVLVKKRSALSIHKRQVLWVLPLFCFVGIMLLYMSGTVFGFYRLTVNTQTLLQKALPFTLVIISSEIVREVLLMQKNRIVNVLAFCAFIIGDIAMLYGAAPFETFTRFVDFFAAIVFPCIASGALYHFVSKRYGALPVIAYRLLVTLYRILIPVYPAVPAALLSFLKIVFPILAVFFLGALYERKKRSYSRQRARAQACLTAAVILVMAGVMMLVSCQFRYGLLVIASESMTGAINKGDAVIFEKYDEQEIQEGQVAVMNKDGTIYVHRIVKIEYIDGEIRYTTKGDVNEENDTGYVTNEDIIGLTDFKIKYIGYPTLWVRSLFQR